MWSHFAESKTFFFKKIQITVIICCIATLVFGFFSPHVPHNMKAFIINFILEFCLSPQIYIVQEKKTKLEYN